MYGLNLIVLHDSCDSIKQSMFYTKIIVLLILGPLEYNC